MIVPVDMGQGRMSYIPVEVKNRGDEKHMKELWDMVHESLRSDRLPESRIRRLELRC